MREYEMLRIAIVCALLTLGAPYGYAGPHEPTAPCAEVVCGVEPLSPIWFWMDEYIRIEMMQRRPSILDMYRPMPGIPLPRPRPVMRA